MHRFFVNEPILNDGVKIYGDDYNHIKKVLRISESEKIEVVVSGKLYCGNVKICDGYILAYNLEYIDENNESKVKIHLLQCLVKGDKMDFIIQKAVELGVYDIILVDSNRCVVKLDNKKENKKIQRFQKISYEASKQSKRMFIPEVKEVINIKDIIKFAKNSIVLIAYEEDKNISLKNVIERIKKENNDFEIYILIGPEGGFDAEEVEYLTQNGVISVGLGPRILRAETAGLSFLSILQYEFM